MQNADRSYAERLRQVKGKIYSSGTPYVSPTEKGAENMLVRIEAQNPLRTLTPAGAVVETTCCSGTEGPPAIIYSADGNADCRYTFTLRSIGRSDAYVVRYNDGGQALWAARMGGTIEDNGLIVSSFGDNFCAVAGIFTSPIITFYNAGGNPGGTLTNTGGRCIFLAVYDGNGSLQRKYLISDIGPDILTFGMTTSPTGDIYLAGYISMPVVTLITASGSVGATISNSSGVTTTGFLAKYNSTYEGLAWVVPFAPASGGNITCQAVSMNGSSVYVTGSYNQGITFNTTSGSTKILTYSGSPAASNGFLVQYSDVGVPQWVARIGGTTADKYDVGTAVVAAADGVYVAGTYGTDAVSVDNAGGGGSFTTLSNIPNGNSFFLAKYDTIGTAKWATRITTPGAVTPEDATPGLSFMSLNGSNLYIAGFVAAGTVDCYNTGGGMSADTSNPSDNLTGYLISYSTSGTFQFRRYMYGNDPTDNTLGLGVAALSGGAYTCGNYTPSPLIIDSNGTTATLTNDGGFRSVDGHILKYDNSGTLVWRTRVGGREYQDALGIATCASGSGCYVIGTYGEGLA